MRNKFRLIKSSSFISLLSSSFLISSADSSSKPAPTFNNHFFVDSATLGSSVSLFASSMTSSVAGYHAVLHVKGIGFKVFYFRKSHSLYFSLGFNHLVKYIIPDDVFVKVRKQYILIFSTNKHSLGQSVYTIRHLRFPDPYRGKGIRYRFQSIKFKPGKQR